MPKETMKTDAHNQFIMVEGLSKSRSAVVLLQRKHFGTSQVKTHAIADPMPDIFPVAAIEADKHIQKFFQRQLRHPKYIEVRNIVDPNSPIAQMMETEITSIVRTEVSNEIHYTMILAKPASRSTPPKVVLTLTQAENRLDEISDALKDKESLYWQHEEVLLFPESFDPIKTGVITKTIGYEKSLNIECLNPGIAKLLHAGLLYSLPIVLEETGLYKSINNADTNHQTVWFNKKVIDETVAQYIASDTRNDQITHVMNVSEVVETVNWLSYIVSPMLRDMFVHTVPYLPTLASKILGENGTFSGFKLMEKVANKRAARRYSLLPLETFSNFLLKVTPRTSIAFGSNLVNLPYGLDKLDLGSSPLSTSIEVVNGYFVTRGTIAVYPLRLKKSESNYKHQIVKVANEESFLFDHLDLTTPGKTETDAPILFDIDTRTQERFRVSLKMKGNEVVIRPLVPVHKTEAHTQGTENMIIVSGDIDSKRLVFVNEEHFNEFWKDEDVVVDTITSLAN